MSARRVAPFKLFGTVSLGLLTGMSWTMSSIAVPALLVLPSALTATNAYNHLSERGIFELRALSIVSGSCFLAAYALSPRGYRHPYLLWTLCIVSVAGSFDLFFNFSPEPSPAAKALAEAKEQRKRDRKGKGRMEASYEVVGESHSEGTSEAEAEIEEEDLNGEEVRAEMESFKMVQTIRYYVSGVGFLMSLVGLWGDGAW